MTAQIEFRIPATGESWRHYKGTLYTIVGLARDDEGHVGVVYTDVTWSPVQLPPLYTQRLGRFLQEVEKGKPRFRYEGLQIGKCRYIAEVGAADGS